MPDLPFLDSFDHYLTADINQKWTSAAGIAIVPGAGRRGTAAASVQGGGGYKTFNLEYSKLIVGAAVSSPATTIFSFYNTISGVNINLGSVGDGRLQVTGNDPTGGPFLGGVTKPFNNAAWYYMEMLATIDTAHITFEVHVNEENILSGAYSFLDPTRFHVGHVAWATVQIFGRGGGATTGFDDLYVDQDNFYGDVNIDVIRPDGPSGTMWVPNPNVANWNNVKDITPDYDVTTVSSANVNDLDQYTMQDIPLAADVKAIQGIASVKKDTAGLAAMKLQYGTIGAKFSDEFYPSEGTYLMCRDGRKDITNPADINNITFGPLRTK
jgi:hypothetical protein